MAEFGVGIRFQEDQLRFTAGDTVSGIADVILPKEYDLANLSLSFNGSSEVKWMEYQGSQYYVNSLVYFHKDDFLKQVVEFGKNDVTVIDEADTCPDPSKKRVSIAFSFQIPNDQNLPNSLESSYGFIKYFVKLAIKTPQSEEPKNYVREIFVESPVEKNLMITVGGTTEKHVLLHGGNVSMHASIGRKGFAPGSTATVHVQVDNRTNAKVTPRITLHQVQIYMCDTHHKTIEEEIDGAIVGAEITANTKVEELIDVKLPVGELLTVKSDLITVKYFLRVTLDIPHSVDLHVNLPVVLTSKKVVDSFAPSKRPELIKA